MAQKQKKYKLNIDFGENQKGTVLKFQHFEDENEEDYYELWDMKIGIAHIYNLIQQGIIVEIQEPEFTEAERDEFALEYFRFALRVYYGENTNCLDENSALQDFKGQQANKKEIETQW